MVAPALVGLAGFIALQRLWELRRANANRRWILAHGGREFGAAHYPLFFLLHGGWLIAWVTEACQKEPLTSGSWLIWLTLFFASQALRYWCIHSLGRFWNTRILILPGAGLVKKGPYRFMAHPNYLAVCIELFCVPMIFGAWMTAAVATVLNAGLLLGIRIPAENQALALSRKSGS